MSEYSVSDESIRSLLSYAGVSGTYRVERIPAGGNNRVYKLSCEKGETFLLKEYFTDSADPRNRLRTEFSFLTFLWNYGITTIPRPFSCSVGSNAGLYQFIPGRPFCSDDLTDNRVSELISFFSGINLLRTLPGAERIPDASDACFSVMEHLDHIQKRIDRLSSIQVFSYIEQDACVFIRENLHPAWQTVLNQIHREIGGDSSFSDRLSDTMRILSPSDFGFHNTILRSDENLAFVDFEYAGWDDPVKTICDLFCQPKIPLSMRDFDSIAATILAVAGDDREWWMKRVRMLFPAYRIKWCCILLNEFLPVGEKRRMFADPGNRNETKKTEQLKKAKKCLQTRSPP